MASAETATAAELLARTRDGVLLYGLTPPRQTSTRDQADTIAEAALTRLRSVQVDGLILYDVDAEADRSAAPRPFPFMPMMDPADFLDRHLADWTGPVVVYRAVGKYTEDELGRLADGGRPRPGAHRAGRCGLPSPGGEDEPSRGVPPARRLSPAAAAWAALSSLNGMRTRDRAPTHAAQAGGRLRVLRLPGLLRPGPHPEPAVRLRLPLPGPRAWTRGRSC